MLIFSSWAKCIGSLGINDHGFDAWMTSPLNVALILMLCVSLMCLAYFSDLFSMGVCAIRHCQTPSQLVQELNVCTVAGKFSLLHLPQGEKKDEQVNFRFINHR